jgi:hypothetical protein
MADYLDSLAAEAVSPVELELAGETIEYGGVAVTAIVFAEQTRDEPSGDGLRQRRVSSIAVRAVDVPDPAKGDPVTIDGVGFAVSAVGDTAAGLTPVELVRHESLQRGRPDHAKGK